MLFRSPVDGRADGGVFEIRACDRDSGLLLLHLRLRLLDGGSRGGHRGFRDLVIGLRDFDRLLGLGAGFQQRCLAFVIGLGLRERRPGFGEVGFHRRHIGFCVFQIGRRLLKRALEQRRIDQSDDVAAMDEADVEKESVQVRKPAPKKK